MKKILFFLLAIIFAIQGYSQSTFIAANGTTTNAYLPVYGTWMDASQHDQFIYPASLLGPLPNATISKLTFYATSASSSWGTATCTISLGVAADSNYSATTYNSSPVIPVYTGTLAVVNGIMEFTLTTPYVFSGGNLLVNITTQTSGSYLGMYFYGITTTNGGLWQYGSSSPTLEQFLPKMSVEFTGGTPMVETYPATSVFATSTVFNGNFYAITPTTAGFQYMDASLTDWTSATVVNATTLTAPMSETVTSLTPNSQYKYRAFANDGTTNYYGAEKTFTTLYLPATLPYTCDFENPSENTEWKFINGTQTNQFFIGDASFNPDVNNTVGGSNALYISNDAGLSWAYTLATSSTPSRVYAYRDIEVPLGTNELNLTLDWKANGNGYGDFLRIYWVPTDAVITAGSVPPGSLDISNALITSYGTNNNTIHLQQNSTWITSQFNINSAQFPNLDGNTWRLLIHWRNENINGVAQPPATIDNITIVAVPCATPTQLVASNSTINSIDLAWIENGSATTWNIEYKKSTDTSWQTVIANINPFTVTGLDASSNYNFKIQADCGSEVSFFSSIISKATACDIITTLPWIQGFEEDFTTNSTLGSSNVTAPLCWININDGTYSSYSWIRTTSTVRNGSGALAFYGGYYDPYSSSYNKDWMISPVITLTTNNRIKFYANSASPSYYMDDISLYIYSFNDNQLVDISSAADTSLFDIILQPTVITATGTNWQLFELNLSAYTGNVRIAFVRNYRNGGSYLNIDDIKIDEIPTCPEIDQLSLVSSSTSEVSLNWTYTTYANLGFELAYSNVETGFDPTTATIITIPDGTPLPYTVPGLNAAQFYSFAVRQACAGTWSNIVVANTDGGLPATLPYSCDFSSQDERASWKISNGTAQNKFYIGTPSNITAPIVGENLYISNTNGATNNYNLGATSTAIASRLIEFSGDGGYVLNFDLIIGGETSFDYIKVFLTDPDTVFVGSNTKPYYAINSYNGNNQLLTNYNSSPYFNAYDGNSTIAGSYPRQIILPYQGPAGTVKRLIILWTNDSSDGTQPPASIDNFTIQPLTCPVPTNIEAQNLTSTSANIVWQDPSATATEWIFKWRTSGATTWITDAASSSTYPLTTLTPTTEYEISIATICGSDTGVYANFNFFTPCVDILIPYTNNFDTETSFPSCWSRRQNQTYPYIYQYTSFSNPNSLYFYAYNNYQYAATPPIDVTVPINTLQVSFKLYAYNLNTPIKVGVMTDPNNFSTFVQVGPTLYPSSSYTWEDKMVLFNNYSGTGRFFAIVAESASSTSIEFMIDNFKIEAIPSCPKPQFLNANTTDVTATMFWTESGSAQEWEVEWGLTPFVQGQGTMQNVTDTFLPISSLTQNTNYKFYVRSICGIGDTSLWAGPYTFKTQVLTTVPYLEPFTTTTTPVGYDLTEFYVGSQTYVPGNPLNNIYYNMDNYPGSGNFTTLNIGPLSLNNQLTFEYKLALYGDGGVVPTGTGYFIVAISTDWGITYTAVDTVENNGVAGYQNYSLDLSAYDNEIIKIKIIANWISNDYWIGIDNIYVGPAITCPKPQFLNANTTDVTATMFWTETGSAQEWEVEWDTLNFVHGQGNFATSTDTFLLVNGLTAWTDYQFYVRAVCGVGDTSLWAGPYTFNTQSLSPVTYLESFMSGTVAPAGYMSTTWYLGSPTAVPGNPAYNIYANLYNSTPKAVTTTNIGPLQPNNILQFEYKLANSSSPYAPPAANSGNFVLAISTDWGVTFTNIDTVFNNAIAGYQTYNIDLSAYASEIVQFKITGNWNSGDYYLAVDNIYVGPAITCFNPTTLSVNTITINSANLNWIDSVNTGTWNIQYGPTGFTLGNGTIISNVPASPYNAINLTPATTYQFYVQADCGGGDLSLWVGPYSFTTHCLPLTTVPYTENFDTYGTTAGTFPSCWFRPVLSGTTPFPSIVTSNIVSSPASLKFQSPSTSVPTYAITPQLDVDIHTLRVQFKLKAESITYSGTMHVGVMSNPSDTSTFELVQIITPTSTNYTDYEISFANTTLTGNGKYIAFKHVTSSSSWYYWLDDVIVDLIPTCPKPTNLTSSNTTQTTTTLSWTETGSATSWNIEYGPVGFTPGSGTTIPASSNPFTLNGLTHSMCYDFYVQAVCSPTDLSMWSNKGSFCTAQIPVNVPFTIDFETPSGFQVANNTTGNNWYIGTDTANTVNNTTGGQNALYVSNDNGQTNAYTINSAGVVWAYRDVYFTPSTADYTLSFDWRLMGETGTWDYLNVYMGNITAPVPSTTSTITPPLGSDTLVTLLRQQATFQTLTLTLPFATYSGETKRIFFMWRNDGTLGNQPPAAVDNISITSTGISTCLPPTNVVSSNISPNGATITWTAGGTETQWQIAYKPTASSTWTTAFVATAPTYNFTTLTASTAYDVKVRAICSAGDTSAYSTISNFTTTATPCIVPTNVAATNITDNSTTITWTPGGSETSWQVQYKISTSSNWTNPAAVSTPSIFLQGLQSNTTYNVRVKALCNPGESAFASAQFTTTGGVIPFTIIASASGPGTITPSGNVQVLPGASQLFTFTPNTGCEVSTLLIDNVNIPNPGLSHNFTNVTADHTIQVTFVTVGIEEGNLAQMVQLYPNPTNATIEIRMNEAQLQVKECRVYDIYGKLMSIVPVNADNTKIDATDFAAGVYFIRMNSEMGVITKKFVKK